MELNLTQPGNQAGYTDMNGLSSTLPVLALNLTFRHLQQVIPVVVPAACANRNDLSLMP